MYTFEKSFTLKAAHKLPKTRFSTLEGRRHEHTFIISLTVQSEHLNDDGHTLEYGMYEYAMSYLKTLSGTFLNDTLCQNPTPERMSHSLFVILKSGIPNLIKVTVKETPTITASFGLY